MAVGERWAAPRGLGNFGVRTYGVTSWAVGLCLLLWAGAACQAQASKPPAPKTTPEYNALFKRMFDDPTNVDVTFRFAALATKLGDYEAAIGALERILLFNPRLARVKLQLGSLYFKLGAYKMARSYFEQARAAGGSSDVQAEAERFVAELDRRESPHRWSVFAQTGLRYQTNASTGPGGNIRSFGQDAAIDRRFAKTPDWNWFALLGVNYIYNLQHGNEDAFEASFLGYYAKQFRVSRFDFGLTEVQAGPRFSLPIQGASVKAYAIGTVSTLADALYFGAGGAGVSARFLSENKSVAWVEPSVEYRHRSFHSITDFPTSNQQTGGLLTAAVRAEGALAPQLGWFARVAYDRNQTDNSAFNFNTYNRWSADVGLPIPFAINWDNAPHQFVVTPLAGIGYVPYAIANPTVDPNIVRKDREWRGGVLFDAQIYANYGIRTQLMFTENSSNLSNYRSSNYSISIGPTARF